MSRFVNPFPQFSQVVSGSLQPVSDGRLYFYVNGTSDLADIFTDAALTVPATNYQPLDGEGRMTQNVFIGTSVYRVRLADSNNATIWDKSNVTVADTAEIDGLIADLEALIDTITADLFSENYAANGGMSVDNIGTAGTPITLTTAYQETVTGYASAILTNVSAGTAKQSTVQIGESGYSLAYLGVSCTSAGVPALRYRIKSADTISLTGKTLTISLVVNHNVGAAVNYTIATYVANAADNFAAVTATGITSVTAVPTGADTTISLTSAFGDVTNGLEVIVSCAPNQAITTKNFYWSDVQCNISGVLLPFRPPVYQFEKYRATTFEQSTNVRAVRNAGLTLSAAGGYTFIFNVEVSDTLGEYNSTTGVFTAGASGFYFVSGHIYFDNGSGFTGTEYAAFLFKIDGTQAAFDQKTWQTLFTLQISTSIYISAGQEVTWHVIAGLTAGARYVSGAGCFMSISRLPSTIIVPT